MALRSVILSGNTRLEQVSNGAPSVKRKPPADDIDAVRRIQKALVALGVPLPNSFPNGPSAEPDGIFGNETHNGVVKFQMTAFAGSASEWDGRVGKATIWEMDKRLPQGTSPSNANSMSALAEKDKFLSLLWAKAALGSLATAREFIKANGGNSAPSQTQPPNVRIALQALEAHYRLSTAVGSKITTIDFISNQYKKAIEVLANSRTLFIDDTVSQEAANGTPAHVPFGTGRVNFTPAFQERTSTGDGFGPKCRAAMVLHEPIHITDHPHSSTIPTHVHENDPQYARQTAALQIHNAHSYACFAQHCYYGSDTRFGVGKPDQ